MCRGRGVYSRIFWAHSLTERVGCPAQRMLLSDNDWSATGKPGTPFAMKIIWPFPVSE